MKIKPSVRLMKLLRISLWLSAFLILAPSLPLADIASLGTPPGWKTYVDRVHGFAFAYPPIYKRIRRPDSRENWEEQMKAAAEGRWVGLRHQRSDARIDFILENKPFDLNSFVKGAPTGYDEPPSLVEEGDNTFYVYGAGGGGVEYRAKRCTSSLMVHTSMTKRLQTKPRRSKRKCWPVFAHFSHAGIR
jgi:hypothetical protein